MPTGTLSAADEARHGLRAFVPTNDGTSLIAGGSDDFINLSGDIDTWVLLAFPEVDAIDEVVRGSRSEMLGMTVAWKVHGDQMDVLEQWCQCIERGSVIEPSV